MVSVQPIAAPAGIIFYLKYIFGTAKSPTSQGDEYSMYENTAGAVEGYNPYYSSDEIGPGTASGTGVANGDMTLGVGFRIEDWQFDYAVRYQESPLDNQAFISVTWGDARRSELTKPVIYLLEEDDLLEE